MLLGGRYLEKKKSAKSQKRKKIIDKAWELFAKNGYEETKVEDITRELGVFKGSFYTYFETKDELLYEILGKIKKKIVEALETINTNQKPEKILEDYVKIKMNSAVEILNNMRLDSLQKNICNPKLICFFEEIREKSIDFIKINIVEKFNKKNGNKYNLQIISEFILISVEEFLFDELVLKSFRNMKEDEIINIKNTDKIEISLKEITKFINNALK